MFEDVPSDVPEYAVAPRRAFTQTAGMCRNVPECAGMCHVHASSKCTKRTQFADFVRSFRQGRRLRARRAHERVRHVPECAMHPRAREQFHMGRGARRRGVDQAGWDSTQAF